MTAFTLPAKTTTPLRAAAAALQAAQDESDDADHAATHEALVALARSSYASLQAFDADSATPARLD